jgi:lipopolysaccharide transport system ATP-binding protein
LANEEGQRIFTTLDQDPAWRRRPRPAGRYTSTAWVPGNLLSEGTVFVHPNLMTINPKQSQFSEKDAVAFQIVDSLEGDSARGDWVGKLGGVVRPLLNWTTSFEPSEMDVDAVLTEEASS